MDIAQQIVCLSVCDSRYRFTPFHFPGSCPFRGRAVPIFGHHRRTGNGADKEG